MDKALKKRADAFCSSWNSLFNCANLKREMTFTEVKTSKKIKNKKQEQQNTKQTTTQTNKQTKQLTNRNKQNQPNKQQTSHHLFLEIDTSYSGWARSTQNVLCYFSQPSSFLHTYFLLSVDLFTSTDNLNDQQK